jgi:sulfite exporter TauE/SafE
VPALAAAAFAAGLLGGVHCAGMCGGIVGTLALQARGPLIARQLAFNGGRILSYALAGAAAGGASAVASGLMPFASLQVALFAIANVLMVLLGLYVAGWSSLPLRVEALGGRLWRHVRPFASRMLPLDTWPRALGAGMLWGWVPCGLVYSLLALAFASGGAAEGALVMVAFGAGTLPTLLAAGLAAQRLAAMRRVPWVRYAAGITIATLGAIGLARVPGLGEALSAGWHCLS